MFIKTHAFYFITDENTFTADDCNKHLLRIEQIDQKIKELLQNFEKENCKYKEYNLLKKLKLERTVSDNIQTEKKNNSAQSEIIATSSEDILIRPKQRRRRSVSREDKRGENKRALETTQMQKNIINTTTLDNFISNATSSINI